MDKVQEFLVLLEDLTGHKIIFPDQGKRLPPYPFVTIQSINEDRDGLEVVDSKLINNGLDIEETQSKRIENMLQLDFYDKDKISCSSFTSDFVDNLEWKYKREINEAGFGIVRIGSIKDNTRLTQSKHIYRKTVEVTIDYTAQNTREIENMQSVSFVDAQEGKIEKVERGE